MGKPKRFGNEAELRRFIKKELEKLKYEVKSEVKLEGVKVDLYAKKKKEYSVVEAKYRNINGIPDDISKCYGLSFSPDVDRTYVAAPAITFPQKYIDMAESAGVGVFTVTEDGIKMEVESRVRPQADLSISTSYPNEVYVGEEFTIRIGARNGGPKTAREIELEYVPSGPFRRPQGAQNKLVHRELVRDAKVEYPFRVKVKPRTKSGKHPFFTRISAYRIAARTYMFELSVKKRPPEEKKRRAAFEKMIYEHARGQLFEPPFKLASADIAKYVRDLLEKK